MMRTAWALIITALVIGANGFPLAAQSQASQSASAMAAAGCGPANVQFSVKTEKNVHPTTQPGPGKALVYVFEQEKLDPGFEIDSNVTMRIGVDGKWVGADHGESYLLLPVDPGNHSVCASWQSVLESRAKLAAAASLTAESGKVYYFAVKVDARSHDRPAVWMEPLDPAESNILLASSPQSNSHPKK
jgi:hypothetical protein